MKYTKILFLFSFITALFLAETKKSQAQIAYNLTMSQVVIKDSLHISVFATRTGATLFDFGTSNFVFDIDTNLVEPIKNVPGTIANHMQTEGVWDNNTNGASYLTMALGPTLPRTFVNITVNQLVPGSNPGGSTLPVLGTPYLIATIRLKIKDCSQSFAPVWRTTGLGSGAINDYLNNNIKPNANFINPAAIPLRWNITPIPFLVANDTTICSGSTTTFTVAAINGVTNYELKNITANTILQTGATPTNFVATAGTDFVNGDVIQTILTTIGGCSDSTTTITMVVNSTTATATLTEDVNNICSGTLVTFTAGGTDLGATPNYEFFVNAGSVQSGASNTYSSSTLANGDVVTVVITPSADACPAVATVNGGPVNMVVNSIPVISGNATVCSGTAPTFTSTISGDWSIFSTIGSTILPPDNGVASVDVLFGFTAANVIDTLYVESAFGCIGKFAVTVTPAPTVSTGVADTITICSTADVTTLNALFTVATGVTWSASSGSFSNNTIVNPTFTPSGLGFVTLYVTTTGAGTCTPAVDSVVVNVTNCGIFVRTTVVLQGNMNNDLRTGGHLAPFAVAGAGQSAYRADAAIKMTSGSIPANAVDVIKIELWSNPTTRIDTAYAWLLSDGSILDFATATNPYAVFLTASAGDYIVVVKHRNHLTIQGVGSVSVTSNIPAVTHNPASGNIDLTSIGNIYGGGVILNGAIAQMIAGNARAYQEINANDVYDVAVANSVFLPGYVVTDVNLTGVVNAADYNLTSDNNDNLWYSTADGTIIDY